MKVIGLCGGSGSGKGTVAGFFSEFGIPCINTDDIYHTLTSKMSPCVQELCREFGEDIISSSSLDRKKLREIVFAPGCSAERLAKLNSITHKHILEEVRKRLSEYEKSNVRTVLVDAPLLYESGFDKECDLVICVVADVGVRVERLVKRDGIPRDAARVRIESQIPDTELAERSDFVIINESDVDSLKAEVANVASKILEN